MQQLERNTVEDNSENLILWGLHKVIKSYSIWNKGIAFLFSLRTFGRHL